MIRGRLFVGGIALSIGVVGLGAFEAVQIEHHRRDAQHLATATRVAHLVRVPDSTPSDACHGDDQVSCVATTTTVARTAADVAAEMKSVSGEQPRTRCFPHRVGVLSPGLLVSSCVIDIHYGRRGVFVWVGPVTAGNPRHVIATGATVSVSAS